MNKIYEVTCSNGNYSHTEIDRATVPKGAKIHEFLSTPGHGYLKASYADIRRLGIARKISSSSFMGRDSVSLEEDCDYRVFMDAKLKAGERFFYVGKHAAHANRGMRRYHPHFIDHPVDVGYEVQLFNGTKARIVSCNYRRYMLDNNTYIPASRLMEALVPVAAKSVAVIAPDKGVYLGYRYGSGSSSARAVWSKSGKCAESCAVFLDAHAALDKLRALNVDDKTRATLQFITVAHDTWTSSDRCPIDVAVAAGVPAWVIDDEFKACRRECIRIEQRGNTTVYMHGAEVSDAEQHKVLHHEVIFPGEMLHIPEEAVPSLWQSLKQQSVIIKGEHYLARCYWRDYIQCLDTFGRIFATFTAWRDDPLWYKKAA